MSKHIHILLWIPLLYVALFLCLWIRIYLNEMVSFEDFVLEKQVNYAADSAIEEILVSSDLNQDYANGDFVTLDPDLAINDFANTLCYDFGYLPTDETINLVKTKNIRTLVICTYDGVYAYYLQQNETHGYDLVQTPKIPYFYTQDGIQYCLTLDPDKGYWDYTDAQGNYKLHKYDTYTSTIRPSDDLQKTAINDQVADIINWALYETYNVTNDSTGTSVKLPATANTVRGEQPVQSPTIIGIVEGNYKVASTANMAQCIGGAQLEDTDYVMGFTFTSEVPLYAYTDPTDGITYSGDEALARIPAGHEDEYIIGTLAGDSSSTHKYYSYSSWWKNHTYIKDRGLIEVGTGKYFDTIFDAASDGYTDVHLCD